MTPTPSLAGILDSARRRARALRPRASELERLAAAAPPVPGFAAALRRPSIAVIAEVKRRSPSAGPLRPSLDAATYARACVAGGAAAVSVLTDPDHFGGSLDDLRDVAEAVPVPVLRKDFVVDELQVLEARATGASAVLLIVRVLERERLRALARTARAAGLDALVEVHTPGELDAALGAGPAAVGVNSRDLASFTVDLRVAEELLAAVPAAVTAVAESGVESRADVERLAAAGADAVLVGTMLARHADPGGAVRGLGGVVRRGRAR